MVAYITDSVAIRQILDPLDLSPLEKPPPDIREVVRRGVRVGRSQGDVPCVAAEEAAGGRYT